jgi:hypothetical protein
MRILTGVRFGRYLVPARPISSAGAVVAITGLAGGIVNVADEGIAYAVLPRDGTNT